MMLKASKLIEGIKEFALGGKSDQTQPKGINSRILAIHSMLDAAQSTPKNNVLESRVAKIESNMESVNEKMRQNQSGDGNKVVSNESINEIKDRIQGKINTLIKSSEKTIKIIEELSSRMDVIESGESNTETPAQMNPDIENKLAEMDKELQFLRNDILKNENNIETKTKIILEKLAKTGNSKPESGALENKIQGKINALMRSNEETVKTMEALSSRINAIEAGENNAEKTPSPIDSNLENRIAKLDDAIEYLRNEIRANEKDNEEKEKMILEKIAKTSAPKPSGTMPESMNDSEDKIHSRIDALISSGDKTLKLIEELSSRIDTIESEGINNQPNNNNDAEKRYGALAKDLSDIKKQMAGIEKNIDSLKQSNKTNNAAFDPLEKSKKWMGFKTGSNPEDDTVITLKRLEEIRKSLIT